MLNKKHLQIVINTIFNKEYVTGHYSTNLVI